jgi:hypothetical protein
MTLKGRTPWFRTLLLIFAMVQDTGSVSYHCDIGANWRRRTERSAVGIDRQGKGPA